MSCASNSKHGRISINREAKKKNNIKKQKKINAYINSTNKAFDVLY